MDRRSRVDHVDSRCKELISHSDDGAAKSRAGNIYTLLVSAYVHAVVSRLLKKPTSQLGERGGGELFIFNALVGGHRGKKSRCLCTELIGHPLPSFIFSGHATISIRGAPTGLEYTLGTSWRRHLTPSVRAFPSFLFMWGWCCVTLEHLGSIPCGTDPFCEMEELHLTARHIILFCWSDLPGFASTTLPLGTFARYFHILLQDNESLSLFLLPFLSISLHPQPHKPSTRSPSTKISLCFQRYSTRHTATAPFNRSRL